MSAALERRPLGLLAASRSSLVVQALRQEVQSADAPSSQCISRRVPPVGIGHGSFQSNRMGILRNAPGADLPKRPLVTPRPGAGGEGGVAAWDDITSPSQIFCGTQALGSSSMLWDGVQVLGYGVRLHRCGASSFVARRASGLLEIRAITQYVHLSTESCGRGSSPQFVSRVEESWSRTGGIWGTTLQQSQCKSTTPEGVGNRMSLFGRHLSGLTMDLLPCLNSVSAALGACRQALQWFADLSCHQPQPGL